MSGDAALLAEESDLQEQFPDGVDQEKTEGEDAIIHPFDPTQIRIRGEVLSVDLLLKRMGDDRLDLNPDFQRHAGIWDPVRQSRLIESLLIRIPIPAFYMDTTDEDRWLVIDGLQRLVTLKRFCIDKSLCLQKLEFLTDYEGSKFDGLPANLRRRIEETQVTVFKMEAGTPPEVKFNVFKRINTGGLSLTGQEIRHALNQGRATRFLAELAESPTFRTATDNGVASKRMADRECVLRFLAFTMVPYREYPSGDLDTFLNNAMAEMNSMNDAQVAELRSIFNFAMTAASRIFGKDAFRKRYSASARRKLVNKALLEAWAVNLAQLTEDEVQRLASRVDDLRSRFIALMHMPEFERAVSQGTGDKSRVVHRFSEVHRIIRETLQ